MSLLVVAACGGDDGDKPKVDGSVPTPDQKIFEDAPPQLGCDYTEANDATNDIAQMGMTAEASGISLSAKSVYCGKINNGHFQPAMDPADPGTVDIDAFTIMVPADSTAIVSITGDLGALSGGAGALVVDADLNTLGSAFYDMAFSHGIGLARLPAGMHQVAVLGLNAADIGSPIDYKIKVAMDSPTRCMDPAAATYTEANDGAQNKANDVVEVKFVANGATLTADANDKPDNLAEIVAVAGTPVRIDGSIANSNIADEYLDRDTYLVSTAATHMTVRVAWTAATADLDFFMFKENTPDLGAPNGTFINDAMNPGPEYQIFPVAAGQKSWLWVGGYDGSTPLPQAYQATICAENYEP